jgi:hypothetical protein
MGISIATGYLLGVFLYNLLGTVVEVNNIIVYVIIIGLCILLCLQIMTKLEDTLVILSSVILGSVLAVRGIGVITQSFPDEIYLINLLKNAETFQFKMEMKQLVISNFIAIAMFVLVGLMIQFSMLNPLGQDDKEGPKEGEDKDKCQNDQKSNNVAGDEVKPTNDIVVDVNN